MMGGKTEPVGSAARINLIGEQCVGIGHSGINTSQRAPQKMTRLRP